MVFRVFADLMWLRVWLSEVCRALAGLNCWLRISWPCGVKGPETFERLRNIIVPPLAVWALAWAHVSFRLRGGGSKNGYRECLIISLSFFLCFWRSTWAAFFVLSYCSYSLSCRVFLIFPVGSMYVDFRVSNRFSSYKALLSLAGLSLSLGTSMATYFLSRWGGPAFTCYSLWEFVMLFLEFSAKLSWVR